MGPTLGSWRVSAAREIERSQRLPVGSVSVDTFIQRWYELDSINPARQEICVAGGSCHLTYDYALTNGLPIVLIRLDYSATRAVGYLQGRYGEDEMLATVLAAWKLVPGSLPVRGAEVGLVIGDEGEGGLTFSREFLDGIAPRRGVQRWDAVDSAMSLASVIIEGTLDSADVPVKYVDGVPVASRAFYTVRPQRVWRGLPGAQVRVGWDPPYCDLAGRTLCLRRPPVHQRDSVFLLYLTSPDTNGVFSVIRTTSGAELEAERRRLESPLIH